MTEPQKSSLWPPASRRLRFRGLALGLGFVLMGLAAWFFLVAAPFAPLSGKGDTVPPIQAQPEQVATAAPPAAAPPVAVPAPEKPGEVLKSQLGQVFSGIREANQNKDLSLLLSFYSPNFPQLTQRAQMVSKTWKIYNYQKMKFDIKEARLLADRTAVALVSWEVETQNISTLKMENVTKSYRIKFVRESGQWRIKALEKEE